VQVVCLIVQAFKLKHSLFEINFGHKLVGSFHEVLLAISVLLHLLELNKAKPGSVLVADVFWSGLRIA